MVNSQCFKIEITYLRGIRIRCRRIFIHKQWSKHRYPGTRGTILLLRHHFAGRELQQISSYHFTFNLWPRWYTLHSKKNSIRGRKKERFDVENIFLSFLIRLYPYYSIRYFTRAVFFFFFSSFFSRLLLFPFYDGIRIVLVIIIAYFDCQCIIITITITTIITLRHVYLDEQNKDNFSRMAVTINDETCDKITMRGDYTVKMYRRSQDRRQYATSLLLSRNTICQSCKRVIIFRYSHARQWYAVRCDTRTMWTQRVEEKQKNDCFSTYTHFTQSTTKISKRTNILKKNCPHTSSIARLCV